MPQISLKLEPKEVPINQRSFQVPRFYTSAWFRNDKGNYFPSIFLIDTGADFSVLPKNIWEKIHPEHIVKHGKTNFKGFHPDINIPCELAHIVMGIGPNPLNCHPIDFWAYLVELEKVPTVLGVSHCLEKFSLQIDYPSKKAFLEIPSDLK